MFNPDTTIIIDTETNSLKKPDKVHVICTRDMSGRTAEYIDPLSDPSKFISDISKYETYVGHNLIQYDYFQVFKRLLPGVIDPEKILDTLVISRLLNYSIPGGHSIEAWGARFNKKKEGVDITDWEKMTSEMVERCHSDTEINLLLFKKYSKYLSQERWQYPVRLEHDMAIVCGEMTDNGFTFDKSSALRMQFELREMIRPIDEGISIAFPPIPSFVREVSPRVTKAGVFNLNDFRWYTGSPEVGYEEDDLSVFNGGPFSIVEYIPFNPASPKQVVSRLNEAGWKPTVKTKGYIKELRKRGKERNVDRLKEYAEFGWRVTEDNLKTLPDDAPDAAKDLGKRIILMSRLSDIDEWLSFTEKEGDRYVIHPEFNPLGAWTHRLSHAKPNLSNVPTAKRSPKDTEFESLINDFNDKMRGFWIPRKGCKLIGTDADGIQMRIFAHIVNDKRLIEALISGEKEKGTDIHSLHKGFLGDVCKSRDAAKTFIYAWLLGAGTQQVCTILECAMAAAKKSVDNFISSYPSLKELKESQIPLDAKRGYFEGLDGRFVTQDSEHHMLAGYLQNGEAVIMKGACREWMSILKKEKVPFGLCTWPHDEWQTEVPDDPDIISFVQETQIQAIRNQGDILELNCPLDGSSSVGDSWRETH